MFNFAVMSFFRLLGIHGHPAGVGGAGDEALVRVLPIQVGAADRAGVGVRPVDVAAITIGTAGRKNGAQRTARPTNDSLNSQQFVWNKPPTASVCASLL